MPEDSHDISSGAGIGPLFQRVSPAEIGNLRMAISRDHDVVRLDVSMNYSHPCELFQTVSDML